MLPAAPTKERAATPLFCIQRRSIMELWMSSRVLIDFLSPLKPLLQRAIASKSFSLNQGPKQGGSEP